MFQWQYVSLNNGSEILQPVLAKQLKYAFWKMQKCASTVYNVFDFDGSRVNECATEWYQQGMHQLIQQCVFPSHCIVNGVMQNEQRKRATGSWRREEKEKRIVA